MLTELVFIAVALAALCGLFRLFDWADPYRAEVERIQRERTATFGGAPQPDEAPQSAAPRT